MKRLRNYNIYWLLLFLIMYSGNGISFFNRNVYPSATIILLGVSFYWMLKNRVRFSGVIRLMIPWSIYCSLSFIYFETIHPLFFILLPINFFSVYVLMKSNMNLKVILNSYEKIISTLAKISLFFFAWQMVSISSLISVFSIIDFNIGRSYNAIVYTIHHRSIADGIQRNTGFCWEPGPFACFLVLALVIYLLKTKFTIDKRVLLYLITILSTVSSTGYLCLAIIFVWYIYVKSRKYFLIVLPIVLSLTALFIFKSDNLNNKILPQFDKATRNIEFYSAYGKEEQTSIGRFDGFLLNLKDFNRYPILGYGGHFAATFSQENDLKISTTSGLGNWLAQYGIIGFVFLIVSFYKSSFLFVNLYNTKGILFLFLIYLIITFSFNLIDSPFFIFLFFMSIINGKKVLETYE